MDGYLCKVMLRLEDLIEQVVIVVTPRDFMRNDSIRVPVQDDLLHEFKVLAAEQKPVLPVFVVIGCDLLVERA